jgi:hypothetical protein
LVLEKELGFGGKMKNKQRIKNEKEFKIWFEKNYKKLGYQKIIKRDSGTFPDYVMLKNNKSVGVELETLSSHFLLHKHNIKKVDEIVCIKKDLSLGIPTIEVKELDYQSNIVRISFTIDPKTEKILDSLLKERNYRNKSHVIEKAIELLKEVSDNDKK